MDEPELARDVRPPWVPPLVLAETTSTNAVAASAARKGACEGAVFAAEHQRAGRGRLGRVWVAPRGSGLTFSVVLRPTHRSSLLGWLPLLAGTAVAQAVDRVTKVPIQLDWPNDVVTPDGKLAGILAERVGDAVVIGIGLNVHLNAGLPPGATTLAAAGAPGIRRTRVLIRLLDALGAAYLAWCADPGALRAEYLRRCRTIGAEVQVALPGGDVLVGRALDVDPVGCLILDTGAGEVALTSGDVVRVGRA